MSDSLKVLIFKSLYHHYGKVVSDYVRYACKLFWTNHSIPRLCSFCGEYIESGTGSVDHIIPKSICYELELFGLLIDSRNMRLAHKLCNSSRGNDISDLPVSIVEKLEQARKNKVVA